MVSSPVADLAQHAGANVLGAKGSGSVDGHVFDDVDGDGLFSAGEPGLSGIRVRLEETGEGGSSASRSSAGGRFAFGAVPAGRYSVAVEPPPGYRVSTTERFAQVLVGQGTTAVALNFGLRPAGSPSKEVNLVARRSEAKHQLAPRSESRIALLFPIAALLLRPQPDNCRSITSTSNP